MPWVALLVKELSDEGLYYVVHGFAASLGWLHFMRVCFSFQVSIYTVGKVLICVGDACV